VPSPRLPKPPPPKKIVLPTPAELAAEQAQIAAMSRPGAVGFVGTELEGGFGSPDVFSSFRVFTDALGRHLPRSLTRAQAISSSLQAAAR
jgi:hypothetical protein